MANNPDPSSINPIVSPLRPSGRIHLEAAIDRAMENGLARDEINEVKDSIGFPDAAGMLAGKLTELVLPGSEAFQDIVATGIDVVIDPEEDKRSAAFRSSQSDDSMRALGTATTGLLLGGFGLAVINNINLFQSDSTVAVVCAASTLVTIGTWYSFKSIEGTIRNIGKSIKGGATTLNDVTNTQTRIEESARGPLSNTSKLIIQAAAIGTSIKNIGRLTLVSVNKIGGFLAKPNDIKYAAGAELVSAKSSGVKSLSLLVTPTRWAAAYTANQDKLKTISKIIGIGMLSTAFESTMTFASIQGMQNFAQYLHAPTYGSLLTNPPTMPIAIGMVGVAVSAIWGKILRSTNNKIEMKNNMAKAIGFNALSTTGLVIKETAKAAYKHVVWNPIAASINAVESLAHASVPHPAIVPVSSTRVSHWQAAQRLIRHTNP